MSAMQANKKVAVVGGGVIGGGWAARFLLNGWHVHVYDPASDAKDKILQVIENARMSLPMLSDIAPVKEGQIVFEEFLKNAVDGAQWIQESVPETLSIKHSVLAEIQSHSSDQAVIASSTSGFKPSELRQHSKKPQQIIVAHPFNPVYLLPVVELVSGESQDTSFVERAKSILTNLGMNPIVIRKEIDAHVADRLLEAVWREALWLVKDDIATTEQIDNIIRYGFGLRWAQMGLFETYRIAGGTQGMAHFLNQFGPALQWPWTKLMDVPELDQNLIDKISSQSDQQSAHHTIGELERIRDQNLVGIMRALKSRRTGVGRVLADHDAAQTSASNDLLETNADQPLRLLDMVVLPSWIDYNGHMTEFRYLQAFADTSDSLLQRVGADQEYVSAGHSYFTAETHIVHVDECKLGEQIYSTTQILHFDEKRLHLFHRLHKSSDDRLLATGEQMLLHVNLHTSKVCEASGKPYETFSKIAEQHKKLPAPKNAGRRVGKK